MPRTPERLIPPDEDCDIDIERARRSDSESEKAHEGSPIRHESKKERSNKIGKVIEDLQEEARPLEATPTEQESQNSSAEDPAVGRESIKQYLRMPLGLAPTKDLDAEYDEGRWKSPEGGLIYAELEKRRSRNIVQKAFWAAMLSIGRFPYEIRNGLADAYDYAKGLHFEDRPVGEQREMLDKMKTNPLLRNFAETMEKEIGNKE